LNKKTINSNYLTKISIGHDATTRNQGYKGLKPTKHRQMQSGKITRGDKEDIDQGKLRKMWGSI